ncbi:TVP38/TMEM64 family protein [Paenibacillus sp. MDMC362]|uniref:TVP38/TMEM64 family protein n=1 Tax=Paenibacillus sp. MDMC362 TaxID=2977365 RepID=UPI000DC2D61B|nr:VTT domain-containing protein [Paenibacillus sp. MDMC362]RAR45337.1 TVP38/TMEM64 family protein [Paenibacillus sp. MDMC362]
MKRWIIPAIYSTALVLAFAYRREIIDWLGGNPPLYLMILLAALLALFPVAPYKVIIAILGYAYGTLWAAAISWFGTTIAAVILYAAIRSLYQEPGRRLLGKYEALHRFTSLVEKRPFLSILLARLLPIIPQMAVNIYAGVASIPFWTYTIASAIGKIPAILLYAWLGSGFADHPLLFAGIAGGLVLVTALCLAAIRWYKGRPA